MLKARTYMTTCGLDPGTQPLSNAEVLAHIQSLDAKYVRHGRTETIPDGRISAPGCQDGLAASPDSGGFTLLVHLLDPKVEGRCGPARNRGLVVLLHAAPQIFFNFFAPSCRGLYTLTSVPTSASVTRPPQWATNSAMLSQYIAVRRVGPRIFARHLTAHDIITPIISLAVVGCIRRVRCASWSTRLRMRIHLATNAGTFCADPAGGVGGISKTSSAFIHRLPVEQRKIVLRPEASSSPPQCAMPWATEPPEDFTPLLPGNLG
ncbi:hypothetical protein EJ06DRAFT_161298 [Trichodelitschia bisporula]|uniref:Uncharacterized protein n=1 Tax=Trichodelitschia bisporula TaxID=703511 RepID=A0A6G1HM22_9PEZI|nr:hypothetical protein EJ06DRAFT_161298 [Trichodelitschia bisporula]